MIKNFMVCSAFICMLCACSGGNKEKEAAVEKTDSVETPADTEVTGSVTETDATVNDSCVNRLSMAGKKVNSNIDDLLDEYEKCLNKCSELVKAAKNGDVSSTKEYVKIKEYAAELSGRMKMLQRKLTPKQLKRYQKLTMEFAQETLNNLKD